MSHLVDTYGYWAIILVTGLEAFGIPIPGETVLIAAGTVAGQSHDLSVWLIWLYATLAVVVGSTLSFWVGVKGGYRLLRKYGRYLRMNEKEIKLGRYVFDRFGAPVVCLGRFVAVLRTYAPFLAGTNRMSWHKFFVFNLVGAIAWSALWSQLSYHVGDKLKGASSTVNIVVGAVAVVLLVAAVLVVRRQARKLEAAAEAAYPGPLPD